jgi:hypothetical protein
MNGEALTMYKTGETEKNVKKEDAAEVKINGHRVSARYRRRL